MPDKKMLKDAKTGDAQSMYELSLAYLQESDEDDAFSKAFHWLKLAAETGHAEAQAGMADICRHNGDILDSFEWSTKAAEQGHAGAQYNLAIFYAKGDGIPSDPEKHFHWLEQAAGNGHAEAAYDMALCYVDGRGTRRDYHKALALFEDLADKGHVEAKANLGVMHFDGLGVVADKEKALQLWREAAVDGSEAAQENLKRLAGNSGKSKKKCYVATCVYGSYDSPEVLTLRHFRDEVLMEHALGRAFVRFYYAISPSLVHACGNKPWFHSMCKPLLDKLVRHLQRQA